MFEPQNARHEFEKVLRGRGLSEHAPGLVAGCDALFDFYRDNRADGAVFEQHDDADMLLFQWGTYDWGEGEHFSLKPDTATYLLRTGRGRRFLAIESLV